MGVCTMGKRKTTVKSNWWFIQMDLRVLMHKYGKNCTFEELKKLGAL